jgi:hypothetical protein
VVRPSEAACDFCYRHQRSVCMMSKLRSQGRPRIDSVCMLCSLSPSDCGEISRIVWKLCGKNDHVIAGMFLFSRSNDAPHHAPLFALTLLQCRPDAVHT